MRTLRNVTLLLSAAVILFAATGCDGGYGEKLTFENGDLFYTENVTKDEAQKLGEWLVEENFFDGKEKSVQLDKNDGKYQFRMVVGEDYLDKKEYETTVSLMVMSMELSIFEGEDVEIHMCNNTFETQKVVQGPELPKVDTPETDSPEEENSPEPAPTE